MGTSLWACFISCSLRTSCKWLQCVSASAGLSASEASTSNNTAPTISWPKRSQLSLILQWLFVALCMLVTCVLGTEPAECGIAVGGRGLCWREGSVSLDHPNCATFPTQSTWSQGSRI